MEHITNAFSSFADEINALNVTYFNALFRLILSLVLGMLIGAERKSKGQVAGIRTFALISVGACLAMLLSIYVPQVYMGLKNGDPGRIAAQVITGIGFLGGGAMIQMKGSVRGLTTAAGIWLTAIIGMAVGVGMYICGLVATCLGLLVLSGFEWYERFSSVGQASRVISLTTDDIIPSLDPYRDFFSKEGIHLSNYYIEYDYAAHTTKINFVVLTRINADLLPLIQKLRELTPTSAITLSNHIEI